MIWDWKHTLLAALAAMGIASAGIAFHSWRGAHDAWLQAQATVRQQQGVMKQDARARRQIVSLEKRREAQTARLVAKLRARAAREKTPRQIAAWLPKQVRVPQPIRIQVPRPTRKHPAPAAVATIPRPDLGSLRDFVSSCQVCSVQLHADEQDLKAKDAELKLAGHQLAAAIKERDVALRAARGGGFWRRLGSALKWFAVGAGAGAALVCGSGHCQ